MNQMKVGFQIKAFFDNVQEHLERRIRECQSKGERVQESIKHESRILSFLLVTRFQS